MNLATRQLNNVNLGDESAGDEVCVKVIRMLDSERVSVADCVDSFPFMYEHLYRSVVSLIPGNRRKFREYSTQAINTFTRSSHFLCNTYFSEQDKHQTPRSLSISNPYPPQSRVSNRPSPPPASITITYPSHPTHIHPPNPIPILNQSIN